MERTEARSASAQELSQANLGSISSALVPTYDRAALTPSIVHFGVGGFHRAHQAVYLDEIAQKGISKEWGLVGVGLLPHDKLMAEALNPQDCLYTVVTRSAHEDTARIVGSMTRYLFAPDDPELVLKTMAAPETRIVTLTITEGGYNINNTTGEFEVENSAVQDDLRHPSRPKTVFGYICEALDRRRKAGIAPFTVLSCDNLQGNGHVAQKVILAFAGLRDEALRSWIAANVSFPNCMVDRITPQTTDNDREMVAESFAIRDSWPVVTEPFMQWIIEDNFCNGRPPVEQVGAQMTDDVHPYEMMKIRLLNASHSSLAYLGYLAGYRYVHEVMGDPLFTQFITRIMDEEVTPLLPPVPGINLPDYKRTLIERFSNPKIGDQVSRLCLDGSPKMPKFLLPSISEALASGRSCRLLTLATAGWFRYLSGVDEQGNAINIQDPNRDELHALAVQGKENPRPLLSMHSIFGDLAQNDTFVRDLEAALYDVYALGAKGALSKYLATN